VSDEAATSELWGRKAREKQESEAWCLRYWQAHPVTLRYINRRISGDPDEGWLAFSKRRFAPELAERGLSLGCGSGWVEREAIRLELCRTCVGLDISEEALVVARSQAAAEGVGERIDYRRADLNRLELEPDTYGVVLAAQMLHHIEDLEHLLDQVAASLLPGGLFFVHEYIGPARFQWLDKTQYLMNRILEVLPEDKRLNPFNGFVKERLHRAPPEAIIETDPSESIRSDEIAQLLESRFELLHRVDFGGTLLQFLLADIAANFSPDEPMDVVALDLMSLLEEVLIAERVLPSDFAYFALRARS
jgi:SAM-dependent methyltransferase